MAAMTTIDDVTGTAGPWVHRLNRSDVSAIRDAAVAVDVLVVELDGSRMRTLDDLLDEYARAFSFPQPWGENWPAFAEFMGSLTWLPARKYLVIISNSFEVLREEPERISTYLRHLERQGRRWSTAVGLGYEWGHSDVPFHTLLITD